MRLATVLVIVAAAVALGLSIGASSATAASCADFSTQAAAQAAANTRDPDGDGIYCESLPCPCSTAAGGSGPAPDPVAPSPSSPAAPSSSSPAGCTSPAAVQTVRFSTSKYPSIRRHFLKATTKGKWPRILTINRDGAEQRRDRLLRGVPTRKGFDRDEYPPAVARGLGASTRGTNPIGWMASVQYVPSSENRSHGSTMGAALRKWCNGVKFRYVFG